MCFLLSVFLLWAKMALKSAVLEPPVGEKAGAAAKGRAGFFVVSG